MHKIEAKLLNNLVTLLNGKLMESKIIMKTFKEWKTLKESAIDDALIDWKEVQKKKHNVKDELARIANKYDIEVDALKNAILKSPNHGSSVGNIVQGGDQHRGILKKRSV